MGSFIIIISLTDQTDHGSGPCKGVSMKLQNYFMKQMLKQVGLICADAERAIFQAQSVINTHVELR